MDGEEIFFFFRTLLLNWAMNPNVDGGYVTDSYNFNKSDQEVSCL